MNIDLTGVTVPDLIDMLRILKGADNVLLDVHNVIGPAVAASDDSRIVESLGQAGALLLQHAQQLDGELAEVRARIQRGEKSDLTWLDCQVEIGGPAVDLAALDPCLVANLVKIETDLAADRAQASQQMFKSALASEPGQDRADIVNAWSTRQNELSAIATSEAVRIITGRPAGSPLN